MRYGSKYHKNEQNAHKVFYNLSFVPRKNPEKEYISQQFPFYIYVNMGNRFFQINGMRRKDKF